jgi:pyridoxal phosphate enzyme (YggS family)
VIRSPGALEENVRVVRQRIEEAANRAGRDASAVKLVAVTKAVSTEVVAWAGQVGLTDLGENYVREMGKKRSAAPEATWHYIGALQSRTAPKLAELADVVHSAAPGRALERLAGRAVATDAVLPVLVQIDQAGRGTGVPPERAEAAVEEASGLDGIEPIGLMSIPPAPSDPEDSRPHFARLRELRDDLRERHQSIQELSMGMSLDYEIAVEEGATMVRVGTALFGLRPGASPER